MQGRDTDPSFSRLSGEFTRVIVYWYIIYNQIILIGMYAFGPRRRHTEYRIHFMLVGVLSCDACTSVPVYQLEVMETYNTYNGSQFTEHDTCIPCQYS